MRVWNARWLTPAVGAVFVALLSAYLVQTYSRKEPELNISCFVYRDINRDGLYDVGDRPYAGLVLDMTRPDGSHVETTSNLAGFANFAMSVKSRGADVRTEGEYHIEGIAPRGWAITGNNEKQQTRFRFLTAAPAGIVAETLFKPMGVAPRLVVQGVIPGAVSFMAENPEGIRQEVVCATDGAFEIPATPGRWTLFIADRTGATVLRSVTVTDYPVIVSSSGLSERGIPAKTAKRSVDFETLTTSDTLVEVPRGYGGLNWTNWVATHQKLYKGAGFINGTVSGEFIGYNSSGHPALIEHPQGFDVEGMFIGVAWPQAENHDVVIRAWRGDQLIHEDRFRASVVGPVAFDADYRNVTRVEVTSVGFWQVLVDDFRYRVDGM